MNLRADAACMLAYNALECVALPCAAGQAFLWPH